MALSNNLLTQFAKATVKKTKTPTESTVYGTTVYRDGKAYVKLDGSDLLTPVHITTSVSEGDRVTVLIKNHTATITGSTSNPSASSKEVDGMVAYKVTAQDLEAVTATIQSLVAKTAILDNADILKADIQELYAKFANLEYVKAEDVEALNADIENLRAKFANIDNLTTEDFEAIDAEITNLKGYTADFTYLSADVLSAIKASVKELDAKKLSADQADIRYATIDFSNIGQAAIEKFLSESGIIEDLIVSEGHVTGKLVGVTIIGDLIEGGTIKADKLVVLGDDGLYYKLNVNAGEFKPGEVIPDDSLHGSIITADSITAEKVHVEDLVAFDATIAGLNLTKGSIYSGVKESVNNTTRGFYMDKEGQLALGDQNQFLRYYKDQNGVYRLEISAGSVILTSSNKTIEEAIDNIKVGAKNLIRNSANMIYLHYYFEEAPTVQGDFLTDENDNLLFDDEDDLLYT